MKNKSFVCFIVIFLYCFFHNPILTLTNGIGLIKFLYPLALIFAFTNSRIKSYFGAFRKEWSLFLTLLLFSVFRYIIGGDGTVAYSHLIMVIECFILPIVFVGYLDNKQVSYNDFIRCILIVSTVASVISTLCITIPSFGYYVRYSLLSMSDDAYLSNVLYRGFGISEELTSGYGYIQGACVAIGLKYIKNNKWFAPFIPLVFMSAFLNARTGVIVAVVGVLAVFVTSKSIRSIFVTFILLFVFIKLAPTFLSYLNLSDDSIKFMTDFFEETDDMRSGGIASSSTSSDLFGRMIVLPDGLSQWIIGRGYSLFEATYNIRSDVGYIIQLNYGGIIYLALWASFLLSVYKKMKLYSVDKFIIILFFCAFLILNIKANYLANCGTFRFMLLLYYYSLICMKKNIVSNE